MTEKTLQRLNEFVAGERGPYTRLPSDIKTLIEALAANESALAGARSAALEEAAKVCEQFQLRTINIDDHYDIGGFDAAAKIGNAIRSLAERTS